MNKQMESQNLALAKELFTAIYSGDAEAMTEIYHPEVEFHRTALLDVQKGGEGIYLHLMYFELAKKINSIDPEPTFSIIAENTVKVRFKMYIYKKNNKHTYHRFTLQFQFKDKRVYKEENLNSDWIWWCITYGLKGFLIGWTKTANRKRATKISAFLKKFKSKQPIYKIKPLEQVRTDIV